VSFYRKGSLVSLLLDLRLREQTHNDKSLDDVMKKLYERFPLSAGGYRLADVRRVSETAGGSDLRAFFASYVDGRENLPLEEAFRWVGLELFQKANEDSSDATIKNRARLGLRAHEENGRTYVREVLADGPAYLAGVEAGDEIVALDARRIDSESLPERLKAYEPDETVQLSVMRRDLLRVIEVTLAAQSDAKWALRRTDTPSKQQKQNYEAWLGHAWPAKE